ncbi:PREDICTED: calcium-transporting ATPase 8, plasma membrane-type-like [Tarenaya hassleriana]|uniref:calcium-transporting ATPase 8, plasma membrane-type-like n=1 Tax=Tarenaya hassleriana TaxID=28532 RepID=UPI0008FD84A6|nr:PREDICTED: calcium-transporting ATPase 8, plasma membrane-type-like [Tarenaya hassleriana]XP_019056996.1 PREDICTED: calcium-transporting ATPase 8, plasma membrane-type-like [Tarenaya hassleriana]XP_019056997.1 PREDICTED: calcium-transporting ATPase 8, plasma membrane-type-like [Tarenaya hassleriana]
MLSAVSTPKRVKETHLEVQKDASKDPFLMSCCKVADDKAVSDVKRSLQFQNLNDEKRCTSGCDKRWWTSCNIVVGDSRSLNTGNMVQKDASKDSFLMAGRNAGRLCVFMSFLVLF